MSSPYHKEEPPTPESVDDLMLRDDEPDSVGRTIARRRQCATSLPAFPNR